METTLGIHLGLCDGRQDLASRSQGDQHCAVGFFLASKAQAQRGGGRVRAADGDGDPGRQAERSGRVFAQATGRRFRFRQRCQPRSIDPQPPAEVVGPGASPQVEQECRRRVRYVAAYFAGEASPQGVLGLDDPARPVPDLGLVVGDPHDLGGREADVGTVARAGYELVARDPLLDLGRLGVGAPVRPDQRRPDRRSRGVEEDGAVHLTGHPEGFHARVTQGGAGQQLGHRQPQRVPPAVGILLGIACSPRVGWVGGHRYAEAFARFVEREELDPRRSQVDPDRDAHSCLHAGLMPVDPRGH